MTNEVSPGLALGDRRTQLLAVPNITVRNLVAQMFGDFEFSTEEAKKRFQLEVPESMRLAMNEHAQRAEAPTTAALVRSFTHIKLLVDLTSYGLLAQGLDSTVKVGDEVLSPGFSVSRYAGDKVKSRYQIDWRPWNMEVVELVAGLKGLDCAKYMRGALAFCMEAIDSAQRQELPDFPNMLPITVGDRNFALLY